MTLDDAYAEPLHAVLRRGDGFGHREHLELAWRYLETLPLSDARAAMAQAIRHLAAEHGAPDRYHATLTEAWAQLVAVHRARWGASSFPEFIARNERLLDRRLLDHHYSPALMRGATARRTFVAPDLRPLPAIA